MNEALPYLGPALIGYFCGSIPTAYIVARLFYKINIFEHGSKNMGATNVYRVLGPMPFAITLFIDVIKGMTAVLASALVFKTPLSFFIAAAAAILGHSLSFWVRFRGGKGVATGLGVFLAIAPKAAVACLAVFIVVLLLSRMVSLGSIAAAFALPFLTVYFRDCRAYTPYTAAFAAAAACFVIWRHKANIGRIIRGTENKLGVKNKS